MEAHDLFVKRKEQYIFSRLDIEISQDIIISFAVTISTHTHTLICLLYFYTTI